LAILAEKFAGQRVLAKAEGQRSTGFDATSQSLNKSIGIPNVVYSGVQLVLMAGLMLLTALVLLEIWQSAKRPLPHLLSLTISNSAQLFSTAVRPSAGLLRSAPTRAPPPPIWGELRFGPTDMVFRDDPLIP